MSANVGRLDRVVRIVIGLALLWYALFAEPSGFNWIGWVGIVPLFTALIGYCPLYSLIGINTCGALRD